MKQAFLACLIFLALCPLGFGRPIQSAPVCIVNSKIGKQLDLPIYEWVDNNKRRKGTIIAVHGLTLYAADWDDMAKHLAAQGYHVFALDMRGFGRWRTESAKFAGNDKIEVGQSQQDLLDLVTTERQAHPKQPLFCLGESLGANMVLSLVSEHPELVDGAILGSPCYKHRVHAKPLIWTKDFAKELVRPDAALDVSPFSAPYLTNDPALAKACDADPMILRKMTPAELVKISMEYERSFALAKKLPSDYPLLIIAGTQDAMFRAPDLPKAIEKFGTHNVSLNLLAGKGHLLMEHQRVNAKIASLIDNWLSAQIAKGTAAQAPSAPSTPSK